MIITLADCPGIREKYKGQKIVLGGGCFDLLHQGHIDYFKSIKALGDVLVVAIKSDAEVKSYKETVRPIQNEDVRVQIVDAIRYVDYTILSPEPEKPGPSAEFGIGIPPRLLVARSLRPDILVTPNSKWHAYEEELKSLGIALKIIDVEKVNSTSSIIERIRATNAT